MSDIPINIRKIDAIDREIHKLIEEAERAVAPHYCEDQTGLARHLLAGRRQRDRFFDPMLFSNPAWDILLNLFVATSEGRAVSVLDACMASAVPQSIVLRWLSYLEQEEMVIRRPDPAEGHAAPIRLSDQTRLAIAAYLASLAISRPEGRAVMPGLPTTD